MRWNLRSRRWGTPEAEADGGTNEANTLDAVRGGGDDHAVVLIRCQTLVETVSDDVYAVEPNDRFAMIDEGFAETLGRSRDELIGAHVSELIDEDHIPRLRQLKRELLAGERDVGTDRDRGRMAGRRADRPGNAVLLRRTRLGRTPPLGVVRDLTEPKRRERVLTR